MAQAVARNRNGYLWASYGKLGLMFQTYDHWVASGARIPSVGHSQYHRFTEASR